MRTLTLLAGLLAGLASFGVGEATYQIVPPELVPQIGHFGAKVMAPSQATQMTADTKNASLAFGALGLCLGGFLGIAGGLARRSASMAVTRGLLGGVLGGACGAGVSLAVLPFFLRSLGDYSSPELPFLKWLGDYSPTELLIPIIMHGLICGLVGASAGLALAIGLGDRRLFGQAMMAGLAGAVLGSIAFDIIGVLFFLNAWTVKPISETWPTRLLARVLVAVGTAVALALLVPAPQDDVSKRDVHSV